MSAPKLEQVAPEKLPEGTVQSGSSTHCDGLLLGVELGWDEGGVEVDGAELG